MFYDKFLYLCNLKDISPTATLEKIGINKSNNTRWANGSIPTQKNIKKLADFFNVSISYFNDEIENPSAENGKGERKFIVGAFEEKNGQGIESGNVNINTMSDVMELVDSVKGLSSEKIQLLISVAKSMK